MNNRGWMIILSLLMLVFSVSAGIAEETVTGTPAEPAAAKLLRFISSFDAPPFVYTEAGRKVGFEVDLGEAIGAALGRPVEWIQRPFNIPSLASELRAGRADAVLAALTATEGREQYFLFTIPYYLTSLAVATHRDVDWEPTAFRNGLSRAVRVGVLRRTTAEEWAQRHLQATRVTFDSPARLARALDNREVGLILVDEPILRWELAKRHYKFKVVEEGIDSQVYAIAVSLSHPELVEELNRALRKLEKDGVYQEIYRKWYDATGRLPEIGK
ncbi:MAG: ABC transporter substrate-binding protein [Candidatus Erginobacter occultus]|nr:ABC transporter substrate-binding protein [Candidatus Erginobacter occultus]